MTRAPSVVLFLSVAASLFGCAGGESPPPGPIDAARSTLVAAPPQAVADGAAVVTLTVTVRDANGTALAGKIAVFAVTGTGNQISAVSAATDASGVATAALSSTRAEPKDASVEIDGVPVTQHAAVTFVAGSAAALVFDAQPTSGTAGSTLAVTQVSARDAHGNVTAPPGNVTLSFASTPAGAALSGTTTVAPSGTAASFADLSVRTSGSYTLRALSGTLQVDGAPFTVAPAAAAALAFMASPPLSVTAGVSFGATVDVRDAYGNVVPSTAAVSLALAPSGTIHGTTTASASSGVATFTGLSVNEAAAYALVASSSGLSTATSQSFEVVPADPAAVAFAVQPSDAVAGAAISLVQVAVHDAYGNLVLTGTESVSLALQGGTAGAALSGGGATSTVNGIAVFGALSIDKATTGYVLVASGGGLTAATSQSFAIGAGAPSASSSTLVANPTSAYDNGTWVALTATVKDQYENPVSGAAVIFSSSGTATFTQPAGPTIASGAATGSVASYAPGTQTITARAGATAVATANVTFTAAPPSASLSIVIVDRSSAPADGTTAASVTVTVRDTANRIMSGQTVMLTYSGTASITPPSVTTDTSGVATFHVTASAATSGNLTATVNPGASEVVLASTPTLSFFTPVYCTIGGTITGLAGSGLVLAAPGEPNLAVSAGATSFTFASSLVTGDAYDVTVLTQPTSPTQFCKVMNGTGTISESNVTNISVYCRSSEPYVTNGVVHAMAVGPDGTTYIGGDFTYVGPATGAGVPIDVATGQKVATFPMVVGYVYAVIADGNGGWYVGGNFDHIGGVAKRNIAHVLADGTVDAAWNGYANGEVQALALSGGTVYTGGYFTIVGGQARNRIAALDAATGNATLWNPGADNTVLALAVSGSTVYAGGAFTSIGGQARSYIAALDATTGSATPWNPGTDDYVRALALGGTTVYAGGDFTSTGGEARNHIAALDATTGNATAWSPNANETVNALAVSGSTVYTGGAFTSIGGQARSYVAALDAATGNATPWNPGADSYVTALALSGSTVYAGGAFTSIGGQARGRIAALDATTGNASAWNPNASAWVRALAPSGSNVYAGGFFTSIGGQVRNHIAALDAATGAPTAWNPDANAPDAWDSVSALAVSGTTVYAGGAFTSIGGQARNRIAALDAATGNATPWNPGASGNVHALAVSGSTVYAGGAFTSIGGLTRSCVAALDALTGNATAWNGTANDVVYALAVSGTTVYAGGWFTSIAGHARNHIAALDATTGNATAWNPSANARVYALAVSGSTVYTGGYFTSIGGQVRNRIAALDATTGDATAWNPDADRTVYALMVSGSTIYAGGYFLNVGGQPRRCIAGLDATTGNATAWSFTVNGDVLALALSGSTIQAGGAFASIGTDPLSHYAELSR